MNKRKPQSQNGDGSFKVITQGVGKVTLDDIPKTKGKNLNVAAEFERSKTKNAASFVVIGSCFSGSP